jgi:hypothetical protein
MQPPKYTYDFFREMKTRNGEVVIPHQLIQWKGVVDVYADFYAKQNVDNFTFKLKPNYENLYFWD